jgi:hypothetical protein
VVVRRKNQKTQLRHRNLYTYSECGSAESTTKQRSWKVDNSGWEDDELGMRGKAVWVSGLTLEAARSTVGLSERVLTMRKSLVLNCMSLW